MQLGAAAAQAELNRENIDAVLELLGVADFFAVPAPKPAEIPEQCGGGGESQQAPRIFAANGMDIEVGACSGAIKFVSK